MKETSAANLVVVSDERALAQALAERVVELGRQAIAARSRFNIALAGGSTPKATYALLTEPPFRQALDWKRVRFFFGDERCVPPDDEQSNYRTAKLTLFDGLSIRREATFRMHGENEPEAAAGSYAAVILRELPLDHLVPTLDLILLGMGPDGHTASLFPGTDPLEDDELLVRAPYVEKFSTHRITLTPRVLNGARDVIVATAGPAKADALAAVLHGPRDPATYPIQILEPRAGRLTWLVDRAAAAKLPPS